MKNNSKKEKEKEKLRKKINKSLNKLQINISKYFEMDSKDLQEAYNYLSENLDVEPFIGKYDFERYKNNL